VAALRDSILCQGVSASATALMSKLLSDLGSVDVAPDSLVLAEGLRSIQEIPVALPTPTEWRAGHRERILLLPENLKP
jgi:hypothetical protein